MLKGLLQVTDDVDSELPDILARGAPTGVLCGIRASGVFKESTKHGALDTSIQCCHSNWRSADENWEVTEELLRMEEANGFVEEWRGSWEAAEHRWGCENVAVSKLAVITEENKEPRLVVDATASGLNPRAKIPEKTEHPSVADVMEAISRHAAEHPDRRLAGISMDVRAVHKRVLVREKDGGLNFVRTPGRLWRYKTCHFGGAWSAYWWSRVGATFVRLLHQLLHNVPHYLFLYVDDFLLLVDEEMAEECAAMAQMLLHSLGCPMSEHKLRVCSEVEYLGFIINLMTRTIGIPEGKVEKARAFLVEVKRSSRIDKKTLEKGCGRLLWVSWVTPALRPWLAPLFQDRWKPAQEFRKLSRWDLLTVGKSLDAQGFLRADVPWAGLEAGWQIVVISKHQVGSSWQALLPPGDEKVWVRFHHWANRRAHSSWDCVHAAGMWLSCLKSHLELRPIQPRVRLEGAGAADAWAQGKTAGLGGWWSTSNSASWADIYWFHLEVTESDLPSWLQLGAKWQRRIAFWEMMAQVILLHLRLGSTRRHGVQIEVSQRCDNTPTTGAVKKCLSTKAPLCYALQALSWHAAAAGATPIIRHLSGKKNWLADKLSRYRVLGKDLVDLVPSNERHVSLSQILDPVWL